MKKLSIYTLICLTDPVIYHNFDAKSLQYIFEQDPNKTTKISHPDVEKSSIQMCKTRVSKTHNSHDISIYDSYTFRFYNFVLLFSLFLYLHVQLFLS